METFDKWLIRIVIVLAIMVVLLFIDVLRGGEMMRWIASLW